jgi:hypothetical protein
MPKPALVAFRPDPCCCRVVAGGRGAAFTQRMALAYSPDKALGRHPDSVNVEHQGNRMSFRQHVAFFTGPDRKKMLSVFRWLGVASATGSQINQTMGEL